MMKNFRPIKYQCQSAQTRRALRGALNQGRRSVEGKALSSKQWGAFLARFERALSEYLGHVAFNRENPLGASVNSEIEALREAADALKAALDLSPAARDAMEGALMRYMEKGCKNPEYDPNVFIDQFGFPQLKRRLVHDWARLKVLAHHYEPVKGRTADDARRDFAFEVLRLWEEFTGGVAVNNHDSPLWAYLETISKEIESIANAQNNSQLQITSWDRPVRSYLQAKSPQ